MHQWTKLATFICLFLSTTSATLVNVTVDDADVDPLTGNNITFSPLWHLGPQCSVCTLTANDILDLTKVHDETWHDGATGTVDNSDSQFAQFNFTGFAIYVYGILPPKDRNTGLYPNNTHLMFSIDGQNIANFTQLDFPNGGAYNVLFFEKSDLVHSQHTLSIEHVRNPSLNPTDASIALLDYLVYSHDTDTSNGAAGSGSSISATSSTQTQTSATSTSIPSESANVGKIIGTVLGALGGLLLTSTAVIIFMARHRRQKHELQEHRVPEIRTFSRNAGLLGSKMTKMSSGDHGYMNPPTLGAPPDYDAIVGRRK